MKRGGSGGLTPPLNDGKTAEMSPAAFVVRGEEEGIVAYCLARERMPLLRLQSSTFLFSMAEGVLLHRDDEYCMNTVVQRARGSRVSGTTANLREQKLSNQSAAATLIPHCTNWSVLVQIGWSAS